MVQEGAADIICSMPRISWRQLLRCVSAKWRATHMIGKNHLNIFGRRRFLEVAAAEPEHQDYLERYPDGYTCHFVRPNWKLPKRAVVNT
jgi:peptide methionine sulfoxide reductase MsrA